jgi:hypothetical protein
LETSWDLSDTALVWFPTERRKGASARPGVTLHRYLPGCAGCGAAPELARHTVDNAVETCDPAEDLVLREKAFPEKRRSLTKAGCEKGGL